MYSEKTCPSATSSTTNLTLLDMGSNPGRRVGKPATNRLSYGAAHDNMALDLRKKQSCCLIFRNCLCFDICITGVKSCTGHCAVQVITG
jgi:hypothetical protein